MALRLGGCFLSVSLTTAFVRIVPEANRLLWVANGVWLAYLLLAPRSRWRAYLSVGFAAQFLGGLAVTPQPGINLLLAALNIAEVSLTAVLLRPRSSVLPSFTDLRYLLRFVAVAVVVAPLAIGLIFGIVAHFRQHTPIGSEMMQWALSDGLGAGITIPACVAIFRADFKRTLNLKGNWIYLLLMAAISLTVCSESSAPFQFLIYPLLVLILLRMGLGWASIATLMVAGLATWPLMHGAGPFAASASGSPLRPEVALQLFIASAMFILYSVSVVLDSRRAIERRLQKIAALHRLITENSRDVIVIADWDGNRSYISAAGANWGGWSQAELLSRKSLELVHPEDRPKAAAAMRALRTGTESALIEYRLRTRSGEYFWAEASLRAVRDSRTGAPSGILNMIRDISERKRGAQLRDFQHSLIAAIHEVSLDGILVVDEKENVVSYNRRFGEVWKIAIPQGSPGNSEGSDALPDEQLLSQCLDRTKDPVGFLKRVKELYAQRDASDSCQVELKDGRTLERYTTSLRNGASQYLGRVWFFRDISERKLAEQRLKDAYHAVETLAITDGLTGLANRRRFDQCLAQEWRRGMRDHLPLSLLLIDADMFKSYNDNYGHLRGDSCLKQIAEAAQDVVARPGDLVARFGGEEFAILLPSTGNEGAVHIAEEICAAMRARELPHKGGAFGIVTVSAGCATLIPRLGQNSGNLIELADKALYQAKRSGRNQVSNYQPAEGAARSEQELDTAVSGTTV